MSIQIDDLQSGVRLIDARLGMKEFAHALSSTSVEGEATVTVNPPLGKVCEVKEEVVVFPEHASDAQLRKAVAKYEKDGWKGRDYDARNHHRWASAPEGKSAARVTFRRFVEKPDGEEE